MHRSFARRRLLQGAAALGGAALLTPLGTAVAAARTAGTGETAEAAGGRWPSGFPLPDGFQPEGITIGGSPYAYVGSIAHGSVHRASLATGRGRTVVEGAGPDHPVIGLKLDERYGRLFLCGGASREIRVADLRSGRVVTSYTVGSERTFINDVVLTPGAAWFTDTYKAQLYRLPFGRRGALGEIATVPLSGDWVQGPDFTANGIERTPDGSALIVADTAADGGSLMRVDPRTGRARRVDIGALRLPNADGLLLLGRTLYVVQQQQNAIDVVELNAAGTRGRAVTRITDPARFRIPTTAAAWGNRVYLPNARFDVPPTPDTDYDVVSVRQV
ncbi:SMP-30/gluconolactonase/LRE family protein [Streptomyces beijiangensis]|uniref:Superoxide dismutase n=1 Tax=Streptomyces beijiangensis TaxID=163361 RepID=A0A939F8C2_9ACTN|nr:superoxide dismutase [Streptomyces beijiangensis]MBO0512310.1 superoxide dismutase [Streptomyces beijiangensis]